VLDHDVINGKRRHALASLPAGGSDEQVSLGPRGISAQREGECGGSSDLDNVFGGSAFLGSRELRTTTTQSKRDQHDDASE
jgi:hypothetical protein